MKRTLIVALVLLLLIASIATVFGQQEELLTSGDYEYRVLEDGTAEIVQYNGETASLKIPNRLDAVVTSIGDKSFSWCESLLDVTIPDGVTSIGDEAFCGCSCLYYITIPSGVTSIGQWAFEGCIALSDINIPDSVTSIGEGAFFRCSNLSDMTMPDSVTSIGDRDFSWCKNLGLLCLIASPALGWGFSGVTV